ncbi:MAG: hypothetical protein ABII07_01640 [Patescibacteria group bacterium]|nr:hypothetical protein [Patescibacteria group bacterium]
MIKFILNIFSPYAHPLEKRVDKFFKKIKSTSNKQKIQKELESLMQKNLVVTNLWMEKKYKNYKYLKKRIRRKMYENTDVLNKEFDQFAKEHQINENHLRGEIGKHGLDYQDRHSEKLKCLAQIMAFFKPGDKYEYQESANFGRLLNKEKCVGDCNQIVTFYIYFYSRKFPVSDLKIKILPGHVCLHFEGIDIEATNATFHHYKEFEAILPITEIISTNLLDITDQTEKTGEIDPRTIVKRAQLAYMISSMKELVKKNLDIAYRNVGITLMQRKEFKSAIFFFGKLGDRELIGKAYHNAAVHYLNKKSLSKAQYYADRSGNDDLQKSVTHAKGVKFYNQKNYKKAIPYFKKIGEERMVKACYQGQYNQLVKKVKNVKTIEDAKKHRSTYNQMLGLTQKIGNNEAESYVRGILGKM